MHLQGTQREGWREGRVEVLATRDGLGSGGLEWKRSRSGDQVALKPLKHVAGTKRYAGWWQQTDCWLQTYCCIAYAWHKARVGLQYELLSCRLTQRRAMQKQKPCLCMHR